MESPHKHHIVPIYRCKELKLTTSYKVDGKEFYFKENVVKIPREQHALIHWGYWCKDLSPLLEHCNPPQWVIDMIPLEDKRDMWSAQYLAWGEIDGIDTSGENSPSWIDGRWANDPVAYHKEYDAERNATPEAKAQTKARQQTPEYYATVKAYQQTPKYKAYDKKRRQTPEHKAHKKKYDAERRKKTKTQGVGTLKGFI